MTTVTTPIVTREAYWNQLIDQMAALYQADRSLSLQEAETQAHRLLEKRVTLEAGASTPYGIASMMCAFYPKPASQKKEVHVLRTYTFHHIDRVVFCVRSSRGPETYSVCFDRGHGSCTCPSYRSCYHLEQLRPRYEAIIAEKRAAYVAQYDPCLVS